MTNKLHYSTPLSKIDFILGTSAFCATSSSTKHISAEDTGLNIRKSIQDFNTGRDGKEDLFILKDGKRECFGMEFGGGIFYLLPTSKNRTVVMIYDYSLKPVIDVLADKSESELEVLRKYLPTMFRLATNGLNNSFANEAMIVDDGKVVILKEINLNISSFVSEGKELPLVVNSAVELITLRKTCSDELSNFHGYTEDERTRIYLKETGKKAMKVYRILRVTSNIMGLFES